MACSRIRKNAGRYFRETRILANAATHWQREPTLTPPSLKPGGVVF